MNAETLRGQARRGAVLGSVAGAQFVCAAGVASAQATVESSVPFAGTVGLVAVSIGIGGLVMGLVRRRKVVDKAVAVPLPAPRQPARATTSQD